jgi:hypothetical protein
MKNNCKIFNVTIVPNSTWEDVEKYRGVRTGLGDISINLEIDGVPLVANLSLWESEKLRDSLVNPLNIMRAACDNIKIESTGFEWVKSEENENEDEPAPSAN